MPGHPPALFPVILLVVAAAIPLAVAQESESFGVSPAGVEVTNAVDGQTYERQAHLQNRFSIPVQVHLDLADTVGGWTTSSPASGFTVPAKTDRTVTLKITVPGGIAEGTHLGEARFTALGGSAPDGSGYSLQHSVTVRLEVTVGDGTPVTQLGWAAIEADDIELGDLPRVFVTASNAGNVRTDADLDVLILDDDGEEVARGRSSGPLNPGQDRRAEAVFPADTRLPLGNYRAVIQPPGHAELHDTFKVVPPGQLGKDGFLRGLLHDPRVPTGAPVRIEAPFVNAGEIPIGRVKLDGEVHHQGRLVATFSSEPLAAGLGAEPVLVAHFTPTEPGEYILSAVATYDGFQTPVAESMLVAEGPGGEGIVGGWLLGILLGALATLIIVLLARRRKRRGPEGTKGRKRGN